MAMRAPQPEPRRADNEVPADLEPVRQQDGTPEFVGYPDKHLVGIVADVPTAERVARELQEAGFAEPRIFVGEDGLTALDSGGGRHGLFSSLMRAIEQNLAEIDHLGPYSEAIREGDAVVAVRVEDEPARERALDVFRAHDGRFVNYFGAMTVELLLR